MFCISEARLLKLIAIAMLAAGLTAAQAQTAADRSAQQTGPEDYVIAGEQGVHGQRLRFFVQIFDNETQTCRRDLFPGHTQLYQERGL